MLYSTSDRPSIKQNSKNRSKHWRDRFQKQCKERIQSERWHAVDRRRQDRLWGLMIQDEWENFKKMHEEALKQDGVVDEDFYLDDDIFNGHLPLTPPSSQLIQQQQQQQQKEKEAYHPPELEEDDPESQYNQLTSPMLVCVNCQQASLQPNDDKLVCPNCAFRATEQTFHAIQHAIMQHSQQCSGRIVYAPEPASDAILGICNRCDVMDIF